MTEDKNGLRDMMEDRNGLCDMMEESEVDVPPGQAKPQPQASDSSKWSNGQSVFSVPCHSTLNPSFDLSVCRAALEKEGFQIPVRDFEAPLKTALDVPSVRRYMVFNSALFHFIMAPVLYVVLWCAVFSTLHIYMTITDYWVLCLSVSLVSIFITTAIIFILHHSNKEININLDVRLIQVNERMVKHKLLIGVADWVQNCTGHIKLYCVYWDMTRCLRTLTETLEEANFVANETQKKLKKRMSHLILVTEVTPADPEDGGSEVEGGSSEETTLLLGNEEARRSTSSSQREDSIITTNYSLIPDKALPVQAKAHQLLMTYSSVYVKLLVSERLSGPSPHHFQPRRNHCTTASLCLCQYIKTKILR
ncbi:transmembrane protein 268 isoform X2 [Myripristis murdjan]|uniref:transmembrane protein 268 isoform X2 n=1 Tax=Myripristis murdjan TaxID=586833 RepID=UPI001175E313|nr:transmembrane protein 268 isoform X2 [Myripristis murdjan]